MTALMFHLCYTIYSKNQCNFKQLQFYSLTELNQQNHLLFIYLYLFDNLLLLIHSQIIEHIIANPHAIFTIYLSHFSAYADLTFPYVDLLHFLIAIQSIQ